VLELSGRRSPRAARLMDARVLVVDDDHGVRDLVARMGERLELQMELSADGHEALTRFRATPERFDLVLLDLSIPEPSGEEVCAGIREQRPHMPVVFMSGYSSPDMLQRTEHVGSVLMLEKPFSMAAFRSVIMEAIGDDPSPTAAAS
jgi:two-component system cell cycle sensor histidine kinase/response regulator CckA